MINSMKINTTTENMLDRQMLGFEIIIVSYEAELENNNKRKSINF